MRRLLQLTLILAALALSDAQAGGRAFCRSEYDGQFTARCAVEQSLIILGPLEIAAGTRIEPLQNFAISPYTAIILSLQQWWAALEMGWNLASPNPYLSLSFGYRW
jgi:hypothetical protein